MYVDYEDGSKDMNIDTESTADNRSLRIPFQALPMPDTLPRPLEDDEQTSEDDNATNPDTTDAMSDDDYLYNANELEEELDDETDDIDEDLKLELGE